MSVFKQLDRMMAKHTELLAETRSSVWKRGGDALHIDEAGRWVCSWRPTRGDRTTQRVTAWSAEDLLARLDKLIKGWPRAAPKAKKEAA